MLEVDSNRFIDRRHQVNPMHASIVHSYIILETMLLTQFSHTLVHDVPSMLDIMILVRVLTISMSICPYSNTSRVP